MIPRELPTKHEQAMDRAVEFMHRAEEEHEYRERDSLRMMAAVYVSMAKELRLGKVKSRTYDAVRNVTPPPPRPEPAVPREGEELVETEATPV